MSEAAFLPEHLVKMLRESYGRFRKRQLFASLLLLSGGAAMLAGGLLASPPKTEEPGLDAVTFLRFCGPVLILLWLLSVFLIIRNASRRRKVVEVLERDPSALVWFYLEDIELGVGGSNANLALRPHFNLADGTHVWFQINRNAARQMFEYLERHREDLSLGYSRELKRRFRRDPRSLAATPERSRQVLRSRISYVFRGRS